MTFLTNPNNLLTAVIVLAAIVIILIILVIWMYMKMKKFIVGVDSNNISDSLSHVTTNLDELQKFRGEMENYLASVEKRLKKSVQSVHTVRFNPFHGTGEGGNQSFATALISEDGDGVVISSLYSRDRVSVFSKPVKDFSSEHEMSDEEKEALTTAKEKLRK
jgi:hypothetical protein